MVVQRWPIGGVSYQTGKREELRSIYPDHTAVGLVTFQAAFVCAPGPLFYPEHLRDGLSPHKPESLYLVMSANPSVFVDITETWPTKQAAIRQHKSQGRACDPGM